MIETTETLQVRMRLPAVTAGRIRELMPRMDEQLRQRVRDQLWLRTVFVEQRKRTNRGERATFDARCDRILELLDPTDPEDRSTSGSTR